MIKLSDYFMGRGLLLHLAVIGVAALLLAAWMATASANSRKVLAAGHGNLTYDGELRTFSFSAVRLKDGTVKGEAELYNRAQNVRNHVKVDCAMIVGNVAVLSGVVTRYNDPEWADQPVIFAVRDNGEGADASADEITLVVIIPPWADCVMLGLPPDEAWLPIEAGNIQVLP